jgi:hypothetical protein
MIGGRLYHFLDGLVEIRDGTGDFKNDRPLRGNARRIGSQGHLTSRSVQKLPESIELGAYPPRLTGWKKWADIREIARPSGTLARLRTGQRKKRTFRHRLYSPVWELARAPPKA